MKSIAVAKTVIINEKNELLVLQIGVHTEKPERSYTPDLPGGFVEDGEAEKTAAAREIQEETGIPIDQQQLALGYAKTFLADKNESVSFLVYFIKLDSTPEVRVSWEHESSKWVLLDQAEDIPELRPTHLEAICYIRDNHLVA